MNKLNLSLLTLVLFASTVFAGGDHGDDHRHGGEVIHHDSHADKKHNHGEGKGAVGSATQPSSATKSIQVRLTDNMEILFKEEMEAIKSGTVIRFIVTNEGKIPHEFSIGNQEEQKQHAEMMRKMPGMTHSDGNTVTVEPGKTKFIVWHFEGNDLVVFACNIPGHYEAGMFTKVILIN